MAGADRNMTTFGALLRRWRGSRGFTQAELAERSGLSVQAVGLLERGARRVPRVTTIEVLAEALRLDGAEREALRAAARQDMSPPNGEVEPAFGPPWARRNGRRRWLIRSAALCAVMLTALMVAAPLAWWRSGDFETTPIAHLVGARAWNWLSANQDVGPLRTQRVYHGHLPASFAGTQESQLPAGVVPIVSYRTRTTNVLSYVRSVNRPTILIFAYNPEARMSAEDFTIAFEEQSSIIHSVHNRNLRVAVSAQIHAYQTRVNPSAVRCGYIPPPSYVDYYLAAVYEPYLQGITRTDQGGFVVWQHCTNGLRRSRGLVEYGLGLGIDGKRSCRPEAERTRVLRDDVEYLRKNLPDLEILEYWWTTTAANPPCSRSWQFAAASSTGGVWREIANRAVRG